MNRVGLLRDPCFLGHSNGPGHVESPARLQALDAMLRSFAFREGLVELPARDAQPQELAWVHEEAYVRTIEETRHREHTFLDPDTGAMPGSYPAAVRAAGAAMIAAEAVVRGTVGSAFALVRPPGHHAEAGIAMGFCLFNNIAIAAQLALHRLGLERVFIVDWDVHHGNGTMHSFEDSNQVLYLSVHQFPFYPGTGRLEDVGKGKGRGFSVNVPLPGGQGDDDYEAIFTRVLAPIARQFRPQLILVSAGFDIAAGDPLGGMAVTPRGFARLTRILMDLADECCPGRLAFVLEGGYDLEGLTGGVASVLETLITGRAAAGAAAPAAAGAAGPDTVAVIDAVQREHAAFWRLP